MGQAEDHLKQHPRGVLQVQYSSVEALYLLFFFEFELEFVLKYEDNQDREG